MSDQHIEWGEPTLVSPFVTSWPGLYAHEDGSGRFTALFDHDGAKVSTIDTLP